MVRAASEERWQDALALHNRLFPLFQGLLSIDTNPTPVKAAMAMKGMIEEVYRLPLCPLSEAAKAALRGILVEAGLL